MKPDGCSLRLLCSFHPRCWGIQASRRKSGDFKQERLRLHFSSCSLMDDQRSFHRVSPTDGSKVGFVLQHGTVVPGCYLNTFLGFITPNPGPRRATAPLLGLYMRHFLHSAQCLHNCSLVQRDKRQIRLSILRCLVRPKHSHSLRVAVGGAGCDEARLGFWLMLCHSKVVQWACLWPCVLPCRG